MVKNRVIRAVVRRSALSLALGICVVSSAHAQSNATGSIFGQAEPGSSVVVTNPATGFTRTITVDSNGRFRATALPPGSYDVQQTRDGQAVATREDVLVTIAGGAEINFAGPGGSTADATNLDAITVTASAVPSIDVSNTDTRTVFTAEQLERLPLARDATAVALLAPSVISSSNYSNASTGGQLTSFGGSAASENAYYINGYPVTNPLTNLGFTQLPYDAMSQVQVLTGGYGAEFGRSTGGVVNIITKRGTNEWHAGGLVTWEPVWGRGEPENLKYPDTGYFPDTDGTIYQRREDDEYWRTTYGAYVSGPIVKDRLFFYATGEIQKRQGHDVNSSIIGNLNEGYREYKWKLPRWTGKIDWNITDNHRLEFTGVGDTTEFTTRTYEYFYNNGDDRFDDTTINGGGDRKDKAELYIGKYTGYLTDNLTLTALYGEQKIEHTNIPYNYNPNCPRINNIADPLNHVPGIFYPTPCSSPATVLLPGANDKTKGGRLDIEYRLGDHDLRLGVDDQVATSLTGSTVGGGFSWNYQHIDDKNAPIDAGNGVSSSASGGGSGLGVPGDETGYYVTRGTTTLNADVKVKQRAYYLEDRWQLNDRMLLSLGIRNENFENYNGDGDIYIEQKNQWAPRIGFSWDVRGDATLKLFANAGRYHLAVPSNVAVRGASGAINGVEYFTYTGVNPDGTPTGLNPIFVDPAAGRLCPNGLVSSNLECGDAPDPNTVAAKDIKPHFQDEFTLGMEHQLTESFNYGVKGTYRTLRSAIDDTCSQVLEGRCFLFNPGETNTFLVANDAGGYDEITFTSEELGYPKLKRNYWALDLYAEHPLSNNWYGKIEYTWSKNYGNTEGQLNSETDTGAGGQADVSVTQDWDLPQLMVGANGLLPNHREHQIKAFGYYQLTDEWTIGATAILQSGRPVSCTSFYPTPDQGLYNSASYRYCGLPGTGTDPETDPDYVPPSDDYEYAPRGNRGTTPWTYLVNLSVAYRPIWAGENLTLGLDVLNLFDRQTPQYIYQRSATNRVTRNPRFGQELYYTDPRTIRFSARFDF
jgi:outer membrane receptor protein involved in Fe transport